MDSIYVTVSRITMVMYLSKLSGYRFNYCNSTVVGTQRSHVELLDSQ